MYLVKPNVRLKEQININEQIATCARVCYGSKGVDSGLNNSEKDKELINRLIASGHLSTFRHATRYFIIGAKDYVPNDELVFLCYAISNNPYCQLVVGEDKSYYIVINQQTYFENSDWHEYLKDYEVSPKTFSLTYTGMFMLRFTFIITTQISTSREFNRKSPNSISEESTRYCCYSKDKFLNDVAICQPHWMDLFETLRIEYNIPEPNYIKYNGKDIVVYNKNIQDNVAIPLSEINIKLKKYNQRAAKCYLGYTFKQCCHYLSMVKNGMDPQDARGLLELDTATTVAYTYSLTEWLHILGLRYYGITGAPHPNAKLIASMIRDKFIDLGYNIDHLVEDLFKIKI